MNFHEELLSIGRKIESVKRPKNTVEVLILTYNSEEWIEECITSVQSQITEFDFTITVHDDASTDNTCEIVRQLSKKSPVPTILISREQNAYSRGGDFYFGLLSNSKSKFVAMLDGDDYWLSQFKLQRQFEEMNDSKAAISYHDYCVFERREDSKLLVFPSRLGLRTKDCFYSFAAENPMGTSTVMLRVSALTDLDMDGFNGQPFLDFPVWAQLASVQKALHIPGIWTAYRLHAGGVSRNKSWITSLQEARVVNKWLTRRVSSAGKSGFWWELFGSVPVRVLWILLSRLLARTETINLRPDFLENPHR